MCIICLPHLVISPLPVTVRLDPRLGRVQLLLALISASCRNLNLSLDADPMLVCRAGATSLGLGRTITTN